MVGPWFIPYPVKVFTPISPGKSRRWYGHLAPSPEGAPVPDRSVGLLDSVGGTCTRSASCMGLARCPGSPPAAVSGQWPSPRGAATIAAGLGYTDAAVV